MVGYLKLCSERFQVVVPEITLLPVNLSVLILTLKAGETNALIFVCALITTSYLTQRTNQNKNLENYSTLNLTLYLHLYYLITFTGK